MLANGTLDPAWPANGLAVCTNPDYQNGPQLASDGLGGAIITWPDRRSTTNYNIYAQRVLAGGTVDPAWPANGLAVCTALPNGQGDPRIVPDGSGGAIIAYEDGRSMLGDDIYAQRVLASGTVDPAWPVNGRAVCTAANGQFGPRLIPDGSGGAIITWEDHRSGPNPDVYAQRVLLGDTLDPAWPANGQAVCDTADEQFGPRMTSDGSAGAIITWRDNRSGNYDVYAQRLLAGGTVDPAWPANGRAVCDAASNQYAPDLASDGSGGAIITWEDERPVPNYDIYAQRVLADGTLYPNWPASGLAVCTAVDDQFSTAIAADGSGGAVIAWEDRRSGTRYDIYAQRVTEDQSTWYLAEGCTAGDFETWVLVQNPNATDVTVDLNYMTTSGLKPGPQNIVIPGNSRQTFSVGGTVIDYNVSTKVEATGGSVICERAMYGGNRTWGTDSIGATAPAPVWYLAEGCTGGDFETWVLVQNPNATDVTVDLNFMTSGGLKPGPQNVTILANSRQSFNVGDSVVDFNVSTVVSATGGNVICERAMYGGNRTWAHDSVGVTTPAPVWYMAEGCTGGDFETWVLVQNPNATDVAVDLNYMTTSGLKPGPQDVTIPANSRQTFNVGDTVVDFNVSTKVEATGGDVICERAMYGGNRTWGTDSIGATAPAPVWYLAEGCTGGDFETWVLVQNPNATDVVVDLNFMTTSGLKPGPQNITIPANSRQSFNVGDTVVDFNVSTKVEATGGDVICERAMYGGNRTWGTDSIGYAP